MSQSVPNPERGSTTRLLCSFVISCVCYSASAYEVAELNCPGIIVAPQELLRVNLPEEGQIIGGLFFGAVLLTPMLYDVISGVRFLRGLDSQLDDIKLRPGRGGSWKNPPTPLPIKAKVFIYFFMLILAIFLAYHELPPLICRASSSVAVMN